MPAASVARALQGAGSVSISIAEYRLSQSGQPLVKKNKFNARKTKVDGHTFDSAKEAKRYAELRILEKQGVISNIKLQPKYMLVVNNLPVLIKSARYPNGRQASYRADFTYVENGQIIVDDVKSKATDTEASRLRRALVEAIYGVEVRII